jgi:hypothetical protein
MVFHTICTDNDFQFEKAVDEALNHKQRTLGRRERMQMQKKQRLAPSPLSVNSTITKRLPQVGAEIFTKFGLCPPVLLSSSVGSMDDYLNSHHFRVASSHRSYASVHDIVSKNSNIDNNKSIDNNSNNNNYTDNNNTTINNVTNTTVTSEAIGLEKELRESYKGVAKPAQSLASFQRFKWSEHTYVEVEVHRTNVLLEGQYLKLSRLLSQTEWLTDEPEKNEDENKDSKEQDNGSADGQHESQNERGNGNGNDEDDDGFTRSVAESSVEAEITRLMKGLYLPKLIKFHSSGREDLNVRMLGDGRPFFIELCDPRRVIKGDEKMDLATKLKHLNDEINQSTEKVQVLNLRLGTTERFVKMNSEVG